jgi:signal transduction histidine kinase
MKAPEGFAQQLACLIDGHGRELSASWVEKIGLSYHARYSAGQLDAVCSLLPQLVENISTAFKTGSRIGLEGELEIFANGIVYNNIETSDGFDCLLLGREAILSLVFGENRDDLATIQGMIEELDRVVRWMVDKFSRKTTAELNRIVRHQHRHTEQLINIALMTHSAECMDDVYRDLAKNIAQAIGENDCSMYEYSDELNRLEFRLGIGRFAEPSPELLELLTQPIDLDKDAYMKRVLTSLEPLASDDAMHDPRLNHELIAGLGIKSMLAMPLEVQGRILALAIISVSNHPRIITEELIEKAWTIASSAAMSIDNTRLYAENVRRLEEHQGIQRVITELMQEHEIEKILKVVCSEGQTLTGAQGSAVFFIENDEHLKLIFSTGDRPKIEQIPYHGSFSEQALKEHKPIVLNQPAALDGFFRPESSPENLLIAPLSVNERWIGAHFLMNKPGGFTKDDARVVSIYADQSAVAIENTRLHQQVEYMAVLEERGRLAREIHDNLAQALSAMKLQASYVGDLLAEGEIRPAQNSIKELVRIAGETNAEAREAIYSLRNNAISNADFLPRLNEFLVKYRMSYGIDAQLEMEDDISFSLSPQALLQVTRIIQEALTNVRKHTQADKVTVRLSEVDDQFVIFVEDNGQGFDPGILNDIDNGHVGLLIMRERAESLGGKIEIATSPGCGTQITVRAPLPARR